MPIKNYSHLIAIARNSNMRIHERIAAIEESDGKRGISSIEEAKAILAIPSNQLLVTDSSERLMIAKLSAQNYIKNNGKCLKDDLVDLYHNCKDSGERFLTRLKYWMSSYNSVAKNQ